MTDLFGTITTGDCRALLPTLPDACAALAFADPPYWVGYDYGDGRKDSDMERIDPVWLVRELRRVARVVCVTPGIGNLWDYPKADWVLGWFKPAANNRSSLGGFNTWEPVALYGKPAARFYNDAISLHAIQHSYRRPTHTCPKPEALLRWLVEGLTAPGDLVIDPVAGSGTTGAACVLTGRRFVGFEIDAETAEAARARIAATARPLFTLEPRAALSLDLEGAAL